MTTRFRWLSHLGTDLSLEYPLMTLDLYILSCSIDQLILWCTVRLDLCWLLLNLLRGETP